MNYTEAQIEASLKGRGAFSKKEIESLMLGLYMPTDMKELDMSKETLFVSLIKDLNKELGTNYTPSEVFDVGFMKEIEEKWDGIPLNLNGVMRNYNFTSSDLYRMKQEMKKIQEKLKLEIKQLPKDIEREREEMKEQMEWDMEKLQDDIEKLQKSNVPLNAANVSAEVIASKPDQNVVGSTGLTATETAYLSNEEKAMRLKQKGLA
jgi:seryl-tRNA synthetase